MWLGKQLLLFPTTSILVAALLPPGVKQPQHLRSPVALSKSSGRETQLTSETKMENGSPIRIGIVGGGIAGVSVAHALRKREPDVNRVSLTVLEGGLPGMTATALPVHPEDLWKAATDRNGNSIVPGASFHIFSKPSSLLQVVSDSLKEIWKSQREILFGRPPIEQTGGDFLAAPPYFALHLGACVGPSATSLERWSFLRFVRHYLYSTFLDSSKAKDREKYLCRLAQANRNLYLDLVNSRDGKKSTVQPNSIGHSQGFMSVHRTLDEAKQAVALVQSMGESADLLTWEDAIKFEPRIRDLPISPLFAVRRSDDFTSSCGECVRQLSNLGSYQYQTGVLVESIEYKDKVFRLRARNGTTLEYDILVLASGIHTPLLAAQLGVAECCPTYPLRGFSLTVFASETEPRSSTTQDTSYRNLLLQPFKVDSMYCTSVTPWMARWVGFGELVGYPHPDRPQDQVPSAAPAILARYARSVFPDCVAARSEDELRDSVLPCFRALSPDDLPVVGAVAAIPGLFLHTGHGSLGWTLGWATGDLLAEQIHRQLRYEGNETTDAQMRGKEGRVQLSDGTVIDDSIVSPARFL
jgi:glycine/D-amino acid oxidase-like deaminating enzyme